jgi:ATP-dependent helicase/nuclease subunit A
VRSPLSGDDGARFRRGTLIHRLLETLPDLAPKERSAAAARYLARPAHGLDPAEQDAIAKEALAILDDPTFAPLFGPNSRAEVPIVGQVDGEIISGQIDRLVVTDDAVMIVDYKTNRPPPETEADVAPAYLRQMAAYRRALQKVYPGRPVLCALVWTDAPRLMHLSDAVLATRPP